MNWDNGEISRFFTVDLSQALAVLGVTLDDVTEAKYVLRRSKSDASSLACFSLADRVSKGDDSRIKIQFIEEDYDTITTGGHWVGVAIKTSTSAGFIDLDLDDDRLFIDSVLSKC